METRCILLKFLLPHPHTIMLPRLFIGAIACAALFLTLATDGFSQTGSSRNDRPTSSSTLTTDGFYFVDDVGLRLAVDAYPQEGFVDPKTYRLGRMDVLTISIEGVTPITYRGLIVNADGDLVIPSVGILRVRDMLLSEAIQKIGTLVRTKYSSTNVLVSLERLKPVHVHVTGDVDTTRSIVIPANTRLSNVITPIILGMSDSYILTRFIEIRGRNGERRLADLESFRFGGVLDENPFIQDGDVIVLTRKTWSEPRISITGGVPRPIRFDYRSDDTLAKLFNIAGGYRFDADTTYFLVNRIENGETTQRRVNGSIHQNRDFEVKANDRIVIPMVPDSYVMQAATIDGEISIPGTYPIIRNQTTLRELIDNSGGLKPTALNQGIIVERRIPRILPTQGNLFARTSDQYTEGFQYLEAERQLSSFIFLDLRNSASYDFVIMDQDVVTIPKDETTVYVFGQVNRTGYYAYRPGQKMTTYLENAGGFGLAAEPSRVFIIKAGSYIWLKPEQTTIESGDMIFVDRKPYEDVQTARQYDLQLRQLRNSNYSIILSSVTTLATLLSTAYILTR
jgi:polysaccharide export outer membrane protein